MRVPLSWLKEFVDISLSVDELAELLTRSGLEVEEVERIGVEGSELPWHVQRLGARAEYWFCPPPRDGAAAAAAVDEELEAFMHLWALNRGVLLTPFHNMALFSPQHTDADVDRHTEVFRGAVEALLGPPGP